MRSSAGATWARALAIVLVLLAHNFGIWSNETGVSFRPWIAYVVVLTEIPRLDNQAGGHLGLLLFFMVSGYVVSLASQSDSRFSYSLKRIARLVPLMFVAVGLTYCVALLSRAEGWPLNEQFEGFPIPLWRLLLEGVGLGSVFGIVVLFPLWSLAIEYYWYLLLGMLLPRSQRRPVQTTYLMMSVWFLVCVAAKLIPAVSTSVFAAWAPYVFVVLIGRWVLIATSGARVAKWALGIIFCLLAYEFLQTWMDHDFLRLSRTPAFTALWALAIFASFIVWCRQVPSIVQWIADISFGLYLLHVPVMWVTLSLISRNGDRLFLGVSVSLLVTATLASFSRRFFELPIQQSTRRWLVNRNSETLPSE